MKAPEGYKPSDLSWNVQVDSTGKVTITNEVGDEIKSLEVVNTKVINDNENKENPKTGDNGVVGFILLGIGALIGLYSNNRKKIN